MMKMRALLQNVSSLAMGCMLLGVLSSVSQADPADVDSLSPERLLRPVKLVSVSGDVQNAEALIKGHGGSTTLTMVKSGPVPTIVVDYGRDVGGLPVFEIQNVEQGTPVLQAIYSESSQYLLPAGDGAPGFPNAPGDPSRVDTFPLTGPGVIVYRLIQGGGRFEEITLAAPGTMTLRGLGYA
jgi:alpha-L-rhamnosidase